MMKNGFALIAVLLGFISTSYASFTNPFQRGVWSPNEAPFSVNSFYVGAGVGSSALNYHTMVLETGTTTVDTKLYGQGVLGNILAGYQANFGCYTLALDGFANITSQRSNLFSLYGPDAGRRDIRFANDWNAGVSLLPGYLLNDKLLAFLRLGYINSHYKVNVAGNGSHQFERNLSGGEIGLGGEVWFTMLSNFSVRGEFDSILAPRWDGMGTFVSTRGVSDNANLDITNNVFQINFIYHIV